MIKDYSFTGHDFYWSFKSDDSKWNLEAKYQSVSEHLTDSELHQVMKIVGAALDRTKAKGIIKGDTDNFELSIEASIPEV